MPLAFWNGDLWWGTHRSREELQPSELQGVLLSHSELRDCEETEVQDEGEDVELQEPPQEVEIG